MAALDLTGPSYEPYLLRGTTSASAGQIRRINLPTDDRPWTYTIIADGGTALRVAWGDPSSLLADEAAAPSDYATIASGSSWDYEAGVEVADGLLARAVRSRTLYVWSTGTSVGFVVLAARRVTR